MHAAEGTRITLRPFATPFPLSFFGLAGATTVSSALELGFIPTSQTHQAAAAILVFAPLPQFLGSLLGFAARDSVAATGMGVLSVTWAVVGVDKLLGRPGSSSSVLGVILCVSAIALSLSAWVALQEKILPALVIGWAALHFAVMALSETAGGAWGTASGSIGLILGALAAFAAVVLEVEHSRRRPLKVVGRRGEGRAALEQDLDGQLRGVTREPGVRRTL
jgi:succinate-acetate transporter protein